MFLRENDETASLFLALVSGLTWIRKWTIVVGSGQNLLGEPPSGVESGSGSLHPGGGLAVELL
jgi:hypothetical protein